MSQHDTDTDDSETNWNPTILNRDGEPIGDDQLEAEREGKWHNKDNQSPPMKEAGSRGGDFSARDVRIDTMLEPAECWAIQQLHESSRWSLRQVAETVEDIAIKPGSMGRHARGECTCGFRQTEDIKARGERLAEQWDEILRERYLTLHASNGGEGSE